MSDDVALELGAGIRRAEDFDLLFGLRWVSLESELRFAAPLSTTVVGDQDLYRHCNGEYSTGYDPLGLAAACAAIRIWLEPAPSTDH